MYKITVPKENICSNRGNNFEACCQLYCGEISTISEYKPDNIPFNIGSDLPTEKASVKSCYNATICTIDGNLVKGNDLPEIIENYLKHDFSEKYWVGLGDIDESEYKVLVLNKQEFSTLLNKYARIEKASNNKGGGLKVRMDLRSKAKQELEWNRRYPGK